MTLQSTRNSLVGSFRDLSHRCNFWQSNLQKQREKKPAKIKRPGKTTVLIMQFQTMPKARNGHGGEISIQPREPLCISPLHNGVSQMVGDAVHLATDVDHYNRANPGQQPIQIVFDFTDDINERKHVSDEEDLAS